MTESSKIYFRELSSNTKQELEELKRILRLLPMKKRNELVDFILEEQKEGPLYLQKEMIMIGENCQWLIATFLIFKSFISSKRSIAFIKLPLSSPSSIIPLLFVSFALKFLILTAQIEDLLFKN